MSFLTKVNQPITSSPMVFESVDFSIIVDCCNPLSSLFLSHAMTAHDELCSLKDSEPCSSNLGHESSDSLGDGEKGDAKADEEASQWHAWLSPYNFHICLCSGDMHCDNCKQTSFWPRMNWWLTLSWQHWHATKRLLTMQKLAQHHASKKEFIWL